MNEIFDWKRNNKLPTVNITPPVPVIISHSARLDMMNLTCGESQMSLCGVVFLWLVVLTALVAFLTYLQMFGSCGSESRFSKLGLFLLFSMMPCVLAEETKDENLSFKSILLSMFKLMEIGNIILPIVVGIVTIVFSIALWWICELHLHDDKVTC
jgi:hypothetical protein